MTTAQTLRFNRLLNENGRAFMIAIDHGMVFGPLQGLEDAVSVVRTAADCKPDAIVLGPGLFEKTADIFSEPNAPKVVMRIDFLIAAESLLYAGDAHRVVISPRRAQSLGADAVMMFLSLDTDNGVFAENLEAVTTAINEARDIGLPVIVEVVPWGSLGRDKPVDFARLNTVVRIAAEIGATAVKTVHPGTPELLTRLVESTPVPLFVLGGPKTEELEGLYTATTEALSCGAAGAVYGRNVWQSGSPTEIAGRLRETIRAF